MILKPVQILECLGLTVPAGGIEVGADDMLFYISALQLIGKTMSVAQIPDEALHKRHKALMEFMESSADPGNTPVSAEKSRASLRVVMRDVFGVLV